MAEKKAEASGKSAGQGEALKKAAAEKKAKREQEDANTVIRLLVKENPKRGESKKRFELYKDGMTVAAFLTAGGRRADLKWDTDTKRNYIKLEAKS